MNRDEAIELARRAALNDPECHLYTPKALSGLSEFQPHAWVVEAILTAAEEARREAIIDCANICRCWSEAREMKAQPGGPGL